MARKQTAPLILILIAATAGATGAARGEDCLAGPNAQAPAGSHWFYRLDRATHRKCWYLGDAKRRRAPAAQASAPRRSVAAPPDEPEAAPAPQVPPRAEPEPVPAAAPVVAAQIGTRVVTTERVRNEPPAAKPQEPAQPPAAAPIRAAASEARGGLPAALLGIALLLAAVGTMLVLAGRRLLTARDVYVTRSPDESATRHSWHARRRLREILAQAELAGSPDEREARHPGLPHAPRGHFVPGVMRATQAPDIAAATLQPAIDPLAPAAPGSKSPGVEPAPDVEQSLRRLLAAWERR
ncbi:MAG TPA: hypothetical protein VGX95_11300, partial [Xanthobacteraceae bacterium]|nr:hypothetical protein [Xanthobacteraceae bacterium]